jgi:hypothetical protein
MSHHANSLFSSELSQKDRSFSSFGASFSQIAVKKHGSEEVTHNTVRLMEKSVTKESPVTRPAGHWRHNILPAGDLLHEFAHKGR